MVRRYSAAEFLADLSELFRAVDMSRVVEPLIAKLPEASKRADLGKEFAKQRRLDRRQAMDKATGSIDGQGMRSKGVCVRRVASANNNRGDSSYSLYEQQGDNLYSRFGFRPISEGAKDATGGPDGNGNGNGIAAGGVESGGARAKLVYLNEEGASPSLVFRILARIWPSYTYFLVVPLWRRFQQWRGNGLLDGPFDDDGGGGRSCGRAGSRAGSSALLYTSLTTKSISSNSAHSSSFSSPPSSSPPPSKFSPLPTKTGFILTGPLSRRRNLEVAQKLNEVKKTLVLMGSPPWLPGQVFFMPETDRPTAWL